MTDNENHNLMAQHHEVTLSITDDRRQELLAAWQTVEDSLAQKPTLKAGSLDQLCELMRRTLDEQPGFTAMCEKARVQSQVMHLSSDSPGLTNLPWRLAILDVPQIPPAYDAGSIG